MTCGAIFCWMCKRWRKTKTSLTSFLRFWSVLCGLGFVSIILAIPLIQVGLLDSYPLHWLRRKGKEKKEKERKGKERKGKVTRSWPLIQIVVIQTLTSAREEVSKYIKLNPTKLPPFGSLQSHHSSKSIHERIQATFDTFLPWVTMYQDSSICRNFWRMNWLAWFVVQSSRNQSWHLVAIPFAKDVSKNGSFVTTLVRCVENMFPRFVDHR